MVTGRRGSPRGRAITSRLLDEAEREIRTRQNLLRKIGRHFGKAAVNFFTSFTYPVMIEDADVDMLEDVLQHSDLTGGLVLIINSPGGMALAAERIVQICRSYSKGDFSVLVPRKAKSAATMVALGANDIYLGETSELGPIGTQVFRIEEGIPVQYSAHSIINVYDDLMRRAEKTEGHVEPFLLQLDRYDAAMIEELRSSEKLATDIAVRWLGEGMMRGETPSRILEKVGIFLNPDKTMAHGRGIFYPQAKQAGLNVELIPASDPIWDAICELYERTGRLVNSAASKAIESVREHFYLPPPGDPLAEGLEGRRERE